MKFFRGMMAYIGTWVAMCAIGQEMLEIQSFAYIMVWGIVAYVVSEAAQKWIAGDIQEKP